MKCCRTTASSSPGGSASLVPPRCAGGNFHYVFKGARSAPDRGSLSHQDRGARDNRWLAGSAPSARSRLASKGGRPTPGAGRLPLALRATSAPAHSPPRPDRTGNCRNVSDGAGSRSWAIPPAPHCQARQDQCQQRGACPAPERPSGRWRSSSFRQPGIFGDGQRTVPDCASQSVLRTAGRSGGKRRWLVRLRLT
jgi:hypothetical protein